MAAAQRREFPRVASADWGPIADTILNSGPMLMREVGVPVVELLTTRVRLVKPLPAVKLSLESPSYPKAPMINSSAWLVVPVGPTEGALLVPVLIADWSTGEEDKSPETVIALAARAVTDG